MMRSTIKKLLPIVLLMFSSGIGAKSISGALRGALSSTPAAQAAIDEYTQTEAHLQLDDVKKKMANFPMRVEGDPNQPARAWTPNTAVTPYLNLVTAIINKEAAFKNNYCVFYQATSNRWRVPQDIYKQLYIHYKKPGSQLEDFEFVRFAGAKSIDVQEFLTTKIEELGGVDDNRPEIRDVVMSVNLYLFGNVGFPGECTWNYFLENKSHRWPVATNYYDVIKAFDVTYNIETLAQEALKLSEMLDKAAPEQTIFQFFVPNKIVDNVAYLSWLLGFPAHKKSVEQMEKVLEGKPMVGAFTGPAVKGVMKQYKQNKNDPVYKELAQNAADGAFGVSGFVKALTSDPFAMKDYNINETQARLLVTNDAFKNPALGVKIFTYSTTPQNVEQQYNQQVKALAQKIIAAESSKKPEQKNADRKKNEEIFKKLKAEQDAQIAAEKAAKKAAQKK